MGTIATDAYNGAGLAISGHCRVYRTSDGKLICFYAKTSGDIAYRTSSDNGATWSSATTVVTAISGSSLMATARNGDVFYVAAGWTGSTLNVRCARVAYSGGSFSASHTNVDHASPATGHTTVSLFWDSTNSKLHLYVSSSNANPKLFALSGSDLTESYSTTSSIRAGWVADLTGSGSSLFLCTVQWGGGDPGLKIQPITAGSSSYTVNSAETISTSSVAVGFLTAFMLDSQLRVVGELSGTKMWTRTAASTFSEATSYGTSFVIYETTDLLTAYRATSTVRWRRRSSGGTWTSETDSTAAAQDDDIVIGDPYDRYLPAVHRSATNTLTFTLVDVNLLPSSPTLTAPTTGSYVDFTTSGGRTFTWTHSDPDGDAQTAWAFRRKIAGAGSYEYWNAGSSAWQGTEVWNTGASGSNVFPASSWSNGNTYNWSVRTKDMRGEGSYASDLTVIGSLAPSLTMTAPTGAIVNTTRPVATWTYSDTESHAQDTYRIKIFSLDQYTAGGFDPETSTPTWDSGTISSSTARSATPTIDLINGVTYRAYGKVTQVGGQASAWAFIGFSIAVDDAAIPTIATDPEPSNARVAITVRGRSNLLTANQASLETDTTGWAADTNCAISRTTAQYLKGLAALRLTSSASGDMTARTPTGTSGVPVVAAQQYTAVASFRPNAATRSVRVRIGWYNAAGTFLSESAGSSATETAGWVQATVTATAPTNAAFAAVFIDVLATGAASEIHDVDGISLAPGASTSWTRGGAASSQKFRVEASDDAGVTWRTVRGNSALSHDAPATQLATGYDYTAPPNIERRYRARTVVTV